MEFIKKIDRTPLYLAVEKENLEIVKILLANENINPNFNYVLS